MNKVINIGGRAVPMKATASTLIRYREEFAADMLKGIMALGAEAQNGGENLSGDALETINRAAYIMAKQAEPTLPSYLDWLDQFGLFDIAQSMADIVGLWNASEKTIAESKKNNEQQSAH